MATSAARLGAAFASGAVATGLTMFWLDKDKSMKTPASNLTLLKYGAPERLASGLLCYSNHCLEFDAQRRTPVWVAEHISKEKAQPKQTAADRKSSRFREDVSLPAEARAENSDYWNSGWSRGHMAPAGNNKHCQKAMDDTFLLSNIVPQDIDNNGDFWNRLEIYCRDLTKTFSDVHVVSGPIWLPEDNGEEAEQEAGGGDRKSNRSKKRTVKYEVIGKNGVSVPTHLYKVVLVEDSDKLSQPMMAAFVVPNKPIQRNKTLKDFQVPISELERQLGYRFHSKLDRSLVSDLCQEEGCNLMNYRSFQSYFVQRGIKGARGFRDLERYWNKAKDLDLIDPQISSLYEDKKRELEKAKEQERAAAAA